MRRTNLMTTKPINVVHIANISVAQLLLKYLELEGATTLFGIPGGALMYLLNELQLQRKTFRYVVCRQETGAGYMADGYARVSGGLGVVVVTSGPGATNALTGSMSAQAAGVPLLTITGEVSEAYFGKGYLQEGSDAGLNVDVIYGNATGYSVIITSASNAQTLTEQALRDVLGRPHRAAHLSLPLDVSNVTLPSVALPCASHNYRTATVASDAEGVQRAFDRLMAAQRPLILLGSGSAAALRGELLQEFISFVERFAIPVMTTPDAKALFPESHPLALRCWGMAFCEWSKFYMAPDQLDPGLIGGYDALLVLGTKMGGIATNNWDKILLPTQRPHGPPASLVQVDLDPTVPGRVFPLDFGIMAEIGAVIHQLIVQGQKTQPDGVSVQERRDFIARIKRERSPYLTPDERDSTASPIKPAAVMKCISQVLPAGSEVFVDSGNCVGWALHYLDIDPPTRVHCSLAMGPMGFAVAAVVGGKMAAPERVCLAICGDGAFLMHGNEVSTAAQQAAGAIWVVLDDGDLNMVSQGMGHFFPKPGGIWSDYYSLGSNDLCAFAKALGADAYSAQSVHDVNHALAAALAAARAANRPQVVVVKIDPTPVPPYYQDPGFNPPPAPGKRTPIDPPDAPQPTGPYNQGIKVGNQVFVSGQGPIDPQTGKPVLGSIQVQARLAFCNLKAVLSAAGAQMEDVTMVTIHLANLDDFAAMNMVYKEFFPDDYPARTTVGSALLFGIGIEVSCVALISA